MVTDYFLLRGTKLDTYSLYRRGGIYEYSRNGFNPVALIFALGPAAVTVALIGRFVPQLEACVFYDYAWFVGFFVAGVIYYLLMVGT